MTKSNVSASQVFKSALSSHASCAPCIIAISAFVAQTSLLTQTSSKLEVLGALSGIVRGDRDLMKNKFVLGAAKTLTPDLSDIARSWGVAVKDFEDAPGRFKEAIDEGLPKVFTKLAGIDGTKVVTTLAPLVAQLMADSPDVHVKKTLATIILDEARKQDLTGAEVQDSIIAAVIGLTPDSISTIALRLAVSENYVHDIKRGMEQPAISDMKSQGTDQTKGGHDKSGTAATYAGGHDKTGDGHVDQHATS